MGTKRRKGRASKSKSTVASSPPAQPPSAANSERLARIIDAAMDAIVTVDEQQRITIFNPSAERMFQCPATDAIGTLLERFLPARFRESHHGHMRAFGRNGVTRRNMGGLNPLSGLRSNGQEFPIEASISQVEVDGKKFFTAILRDVSEAMKAREASSRLAAIVESSQDAIISKSLNGIISSWNPAAERLFGYSPEEAIGQPMLLIIPPDMEQEEHDILARVARGDRLQLFETARIRKDGKKIDVAVSISPLRDAAGRIVGASTIAQDLTEHKRSVEQSRQQSGLLDLATALVRDMDDRIVQWTRGAEQLYGYAKSEALGKTSHDLLKTIFPQPLPDIYEVLNARGAWEGELEHRTREGKQVVVASRWVVHYDEKHQPVRILEVCADITALKHAEVLQLRSQKLESLGTLAGGIAHDFNNILSAINGSAALAMSQFPQDHPVQPCLVEIERAGLRAADLVRRILSFSRPQEQNMVVQDVEPIVQEALKLVRATLPAMIEIRATFEKDLPKARFDSTQIHQVIVNLATNASHAIGEKHGLIEIKVDARTVNGAESPAYADVPPGDYLHLQVADSGCGMDSGTLKRIFDPFFTTKPTGKGTGLGLSVVHGIISAHHGSVKVYSQPGEGTTFHVYIPSVQDAATPVRPPSDEPAPAGHGERILFVDDENVLVFIGSMTLEQKGYKVTGQPNGEAALVELRKDPNAYDAVITDLSMPGISGLELAAEIRLIRSDLPILLASGYINPDDQEKAVKLGVRAILQKPVKAKELLVNLAAILEKAPQRHSVR